MRFGQQYSRLRGTDPFGATWQRFTYPTTGSWNSVAFGRDRFIAWRAGSANGMSSSDGYNWTTLTIGDGSISYNAVIFGDGIFVVLGQAGQTATSPNGIAWTINPTALDAGQTGWIGSFGNGLFLASPAAAVPWIATSPDGVTWTEQTLPAAAGGLSVAFGNGLFVTSVNGSGVYFTSPDGITWTQRAFPNAAVAYLVRFNGSVFAAGATGGVESYVSSDGLNWTVTPGTRAFRSLTAGNGAFVGASTVNGIGWSSVDGVTWTSRTLITGNFSGCGYGEPFGNPTFLLFATGLGVKYGVAST